jgi:hydrogenase/urease accessory protein HupE
MQPVLPDGCEPITEQDWAYEGTGVRINWQLRCAQPLAGQTIQATGLAENQSSALIRIEWLDGGVTRGILNGAAPSFAVPGDVGALQVSVDYALMGVEHILSGPDHLLFVLGLLLLAASTSRLIWTITAFTVGHSVTLGLAALGYVRYPVDLVEFAIAFSIFIVAVELTREATDRHWLRRRPWLPAVSFGLLHGMGFAGALLEVGLPFGDIPLALLSFNVGIEIGQLLFVAAVLVAGALWQRTPLRSFTALQWVPIYLIGVPSVYWCIERGLATLGLG